MIESLGALGGYGITSVIVIVVAFFLFARFVKKIIGNIIMGGLLFWLLNTIGITHMTFRRRPLQAFLNSTLRASTVRLQSKHRGMPQCVKTTFLMTVHISAQKLLSRPLR